MRATFAHTLGMNGTADENELEALERRGWEALSGANGAAFYEEVMSDHRLMVFPGLVMDKATVLDAIGKAAPWSGFDLHDVRVTATDRVGLVTYRAVAQRSGQPQYEAMMSSVYAREGDDWRLLLHQQSP